MIMSAMRFRDPATDEYKLLGLAIERQPNESATEAIVMAMMAEQNTKFELVDAGGDCFIFRPIP